MAYEHFLDLRFYRWHHGHKGERMVRLELAVPAHEVLLHAYGAWHWVLNQDYLPAEDPDDPRVGDREEDAWNAELAGAGVGWRPLAEMPEPFRGRILASWERIFDVELLRPTNTIQATFERLRLRDVRSAVEFTSVATWPGGD